MLSATATLPPERYSHFKKRWKTFSAPNASYSKKYLSQYKLQLPKLEIKDNCYEGRNIDLGGANIFSGQVFFILKNLLYSTFVFDFQL